MIFLAGVILIIIIIAIIAGFAANAFRSTDEMIDRWTDRAIIDEAKRIDEFNPANEKKVRKLISKLAPIASRNEEAKEIRNQLKKALEEEED